jgi:hypothetical protein
MPSRVIQVNWDAHYIPLAETGSIGGHAAYFVLATALAGKGIPYATFSCVHGSSSSSRRS